MRDNGSIGRPVEAVVATVLDRDDDRDPGTVREALDPVTDDGVVTTDAVEAAVSDTSKVVATAETRVELAAIAHADATDAAAPVEDLDVVAARLDGYHDRLDKIESRAAALTDDLPGPVAGPDEPTALYEQAVALREVATAAQGVARTADELALDLEAFEAWLDSPPRRYDAVAADVDLVDESLGELADTVDALPASDAPAADWADATMRTRVLELLVDDLRAELDDLRAWADREAVPFRADLEDRLAALESRTGELAGTLADRADPAWRDRFDEPLAAFEHDLEPLAPPVDWTRVQATLEERRERAFDDR